MTTQTKGRIEFAGLIIGILGGIGGIAGLIGAFYLLPYRLEAAEKRIEVISIQRTADRELLTRIEERVISIQQDLRRIKYNNERQP